MKRIASKISAFLVLLMLISLVSAPDVHANQQSFGFILALGATYKEGVVNPVYLAPNSTVDKMLTQYDTYRGLRQQMGSSIKIYDVFVKIVGKVGVKDPTDITNTPIVQSMSVAPASAIETMRTEYRKGNGVYITFNLRGHITKVSPITSNSNQEDSPATGIDRVRITATVSSSGGGTISGSGSFNTGTSTQLTARANSGWIFDGWYENGTNVSKKAAWRFDATRNMTIEARFIKTGGSASQSLPTQPQLAVANSVDGDFVVTIPANTTVYGYASSTSTSKFTLYTPKTTSYNLYCTERLDMSDGTTRYFFRSGGNTAQDYYLMFTNSMNVTDSLATQRKVAIQYNANGGSGAPEKQEFTVDSRAVLSSTIPVQNGYVFAGWSLTGTSGSTLYSPGSRYNIDRDTTFYAMWTSTVTYTLTYDANGGIGAPPSQTTKAMEVWTLSSVVPTRTGYAFAGWADSAGAYHVIWNPNQSLMSRSDKTIYAVWRKIPEPSIDPLTLDVYQLDAGWINMVTRSIGGRESDGKYQCDVFFGVQYKIKCSKAIGSYGIEIFDKQKNLLSTITKEPISSAETWISEKTNIYRLSYIDNEGKVESISHTPLYTSLRRNETYYWRIYFMCDGQRIETDMESFIFTIEEGYY